MVYGGEGRGGEHWGWGDGEDEAMRRRYEILVTLILVF